MIIRICGLAGSGKSTIGKALAKRLGYNYYDIGDLRKQMAKDRGMTLEEFNKLGEKESFTDIEADNFTKKLAKTEDNFVIQGRTAYYFIPKSFKMFFKVSPEVAAERVFNDKDSDRSSEQVPKNVEDKKRLLVERDASDVLRYRKHYGIENYQDPKNFDFIYDTSNDEGIEKHVDDIMNFLRSKKLVD